MSALRRPRRLRPAPSAASARARGRPEPPADAYAAAVRLLARRELSEAQLRDRLLGSFDGSQVDAALDRLRDSGSVDDRRVAFAHARTAIAVKRRGHLRVARELEAMGIDPAVAQEAVDAAHDEVDEDALLERELERRAAGRALDQRARRRLYGQLLRQGFSADRIISALRRRRLEPNDD